MCNPLLALAVVQAGQQIGAQQSQLAQQKDIFNATEKSATNNAFETYNALARRQIEDSSSLQTSMNQNAERARAARSTAAVSAAEAGTGGASVEALLGEYTRAELNYQAGLIRKQRFVDIQYENEKRAARYGAQSAINAAVPTAAGPDYIGAALRIGGGYIDARESSSTVGPDGKRIYHGIGYGD